MNMSFTLAIMGASSIGQISALAKFAGSVLMITTGRIALSRGGGDMRTGDY